MPGRSLVVLLVDLSFKMIPLGYTRNLFLRSLCIVYLFAFLSFYVQIPGLYGNNGILPVRSVLENSEHKTLLAKVHYLPTLVWLASYLTLDPHYALDVLAILGSFLAFTGFISQKLCTIPLFATLWSLYFSLYQVGQDFMRNNYDDLLLEIGFITLLIAPMFPGRRRGSKGSALDVLSFWLIKWLLFRYLFTTGLSKLISGCPKWWSLNALGYHFESMPLPTPLSWYVHHLPEWILRLSVVFSNVCEVAIPCFFFFPLRNVRMTAFVFQIFLQMCIVLTGNFNFSNLLIVAMLLSLLDDQFSYPNKKQSSQSWNALNSIINLVHYGVLLYGVIVLYSLKLNGSKIDAKIAFTEEQLNAVLKPALTVIACVALISLGLSIFKSLSNAVYNSHSTYPKVVTVFTTLLYSGLAVLLYLGSSVPLASLHPGHNSTISPTVRTIYARLHKLHVINHYALFSKMTGVDGRPEIIIEGADSAEGPWQEYSFLYKPGNVNHSMPFVAPHSPRLDWQMYWAAYSSYEKQPWILSLAHRLLLGQPEVLSLLDSHHSPFTKKPPKYIRASLYKYKYTPWNQRKSSSWWQRERVRDYFPVVNKDSSFLLDFLKARNLLPSSFQEQRVGTLWKQILDGIRYIVSPLEATLLLWSVFAAGCAIITTSGKKLRHAQ